MINNVFTIVIFYITNNNNHNNIWIFILHNYYYKVLLFQVKVCSIVVNTTNVELNKF